MTPDGRLKPMRRWMILSLFWIFGTNWALAQNLVSPWDLKPVALTDTPYNCPAPMHLPANVDVGGSYYTDAHHSIADPEIKASYLAKKKPYDNFTKMIVDAADAYQTTGSRQAALGATSLLESAAKDNFLGGSCVTGQDSYVQGWLGGSVIIAYLKVRPSGLITPEQTGVILPWLKLIATHTQTYFDPKNTGAKATKVLNNHLYWAGIPVITAGIATNDRDLFNWGIQTYEVGVSQVTPEGTLPKEMDRAARALHYHIFAIAPLVMLAEYGEDNGIEMYARHNDALKRLIQRTVDGILDPSYFDKATGVKQETIKTLDADDIAWAKPYLHRFPDPPNPTLEKFLSQTKSLDDLYMGGLPPE
jgi:poly(beta-D-mannuronate) lyase